MNTKKALSILAIAIVGGVVALGVNRLFERPSTPQTFQEHQAAKFTLAEKLSDVPDVDFVSVAQVATPAVVHIKSTVKAQPGISNGYNPFEEFFNNPRFQQPGPQEATGSGVVIKNNGFIVTNNHVVEGASKVEVILQDKRSYIAEVMGTDPETDLALLKIEEENLPYLNLGNSDDLKVGEWVVAVGNPFNLTSTVTAGIVSAKGRSINLLRQKGGDYAVENFIQTDAAVNPGNSGGALVNTSGELVGINTAIASQTGSYSGYSFAIPINLAKKIIDDLKKYGEVKRAILGVRIQDITQDLADEHGLKDLKGVYIPDVNDGGAADKAGIKAGDVITKINDVKVNKSSALQEQISKFHPGEKITVTLFRDGKEKVMDVTLLSKDGEKEINTEIVRENTKVLGAQMENLSRDERLKLKIKNGVRVAKVGSGVLKQKGIPSGFVITHIDKSPVYTTKDVANALDDKEGAVLIEGVTPDGENEAFAIRID